MEKSGRTASDRIGMRFGRLTITGIERRGKKRDIYCNCLCDCGTEKPVRLSHLVSGKIRSCNCLNQELKSQRKTHGQSRSGLYAIWNSMISRCENPNNKFFHRYGGRGISICRRWRESFVAFAEDMGPKPEGKSLDRYPNPDGNYEPGNVRWATQSQQCQNFSTTNRVVEFHGKTMCVREWERTLGFNNGVIWRRLFYRGWSVEKALTTPVVHEHGEEIGT